jgi:hypothetical protein
VPTFLIKAGDVVSYKTICQMPGQVSVTSRQYQLVQSTSSIECPSNAFLAKVEADLAPMFKNLMAQQATYYGTMLYLDTPVAGGWRPDTRGAERGIGTGGPTALPHQTCGLISLYSNTAGKKGQGRIYTPFPPGIANDIDGMPTAAYLTALDGLGEVLVANQSVTVEGQTHLFVPCLYRKGGVPYQIGAYTVRPGWATQRRRGNFGPTNELPF